MSHRLCNGISAIDIWLFDNAYRASAMRKVWPFNPSEFCWADRGLERLFEGASRIDSRQAIERSLGFGPHRYKAVRTAELLRWAELQGIVEKEMADGKISWRRLRHGVTFIHRLGRPADVRTAQPFINGQSIDALVSREVGFRARKRQIGVDWHLDKLRRFIDDMGGSACLAPNAFEPEGWIIEYAWQLREELDGRVRHLPLYRLTQITDAVLHLSPQEDIYFSPSELDHLKL